MKALSIIDVLVRDMPKAHNKKAIIKNQQKLVHVFLPKGFLEIQKK